MPTGVSGSDKNHYLYTIDISTATDAAPITITGANNPRVNGRWKITAVNSTAFTLDNSNGSFAIVGATNTAPIVITTRPANQDGGSQTGE